MQMREAEIVRDYRQAKNKGHQVGILAELNLCPKEEIINILKANGVSQAELPRQRKRKEPTATEQGTKEPEIENTAESEPVAAGREELPEIVKEVICKQMEREQDGIDYHSARLKELSEFLRGGGDE